MSKATNVTGDIDEFKDACDVDEFQDAKAVVTDPIEQKYLDDVDKEFNDCLRIDDVRHQNKSKSSFENEYDETKFNSAENTTPGFIDIEAEEMRRREEEESNLSEETRQDRKVSSLKLKEVGNEFYKNSEFKEAVEKYTSALQLCPVVFKTERAQMFSNRAACYIKMESPEFALSDCDAALNLQPDYVKCLLRRAELRETTDRLRDALEDYEALLKLDPGNVRAKCACAILPEKIKAQEEKMKAEMIGQLKQMGNLFLKPFGLSTDNFKVNQDPNTGGYSINMAN